ncbi:MAG TPA: MFS transporter [Blastococcus sp.]
MTTAAHRATVDRPPLFTRTFLLLLAGGFCFFAAFGMTVPVLPLLVTERLGGNDLGVGVIVGAMAVSAIAIRPWAGRRANHWGRQRLIVVGIVIGGLSFALSGIAPNLVGLGVLRLLTGVAQALVLIGAVTTVMDAVPENRRGEGISYFSVAPYLGIGLGAVAGQAVYEALGFELSFVVAGAVTLLGVLPILGVPNMVIRAQPGEAPQRHFHPAAILPGAIFALGLVGPVAFTSFIALYVRDFDVDSPEWLLLAYSGCVLAARILGGRIPDLFGPRIVGPLSAVLLAVGLGTIALTPVAWGLYVGIVPFALGISLQYPAMLTLALSRVPERERAVGVATFTMFFDVAQGLGGGVVGVLAALGGYRVAFGGCAVLALIGLAALWFGLLRPSATAGAAEDGHPPHDPTADQPETAERAMRLE